MGSSLYSPLVSPLSSSLLLPYSRDYASDLEWVIESCRSFPVRALNQLNHLSLWRMPLNFSQECDCPSSSFLPSTSSLPPPPTDTTDIIFRVVMAASSPRCAMKRGNPLHLSNLPSICWLEFIVFFNVSYQSCLFSFFCSLSSQWYSSLNPKVLLQFCVWIN